MPRMTERDWERPNHSKFLWEAEKVVNATLGSRFKDKSDKQARARAFAVEALAKALMIQEDET